MSIISKEPSLPQAQDKIFSDPAILRFPDPAEVWLAGKTPLPERRPTLPTHYCWGTVPSGWQTEKQLLKSLHRLRRGARPAGKIMLIFDEQHKRQGRTPRVPPEVCERLRRQWADPDVGARPEDLKLLRGSGQLVTVNLYRPSDAVEITRFSADNRHGDETVASEVEAGKLLWYNTFDGSSRRKYITNDARTKDGDLPRVSPEYTAEAEWEPDPPFRPEQPRNTRRMDVSLPDLVGHLSGDDRFAGPREDPPDGDDTTPADRDPAQQPMGPFIAIDPDRHDGRIPGEYQVRLVLRMREVLAQQFDVPFSADVNPNNGSARFNLWLAGDRTKVERQSWCEAIRAKFQEEIPDHDFAKMEIWPSGSCAAQGVFAPLRPDKVSVVGGGVLAKVWRYKQPKGGERQYSEVYSAAAYMQWRHFEKTPPSATVLEEVLRKAVANCPDLPEGASPPREKKKSRSPRPKQAPGVPADRSGKTSWRGQTALKLYLFWAGLAEPAPGTLGDYLIVTIRVLFFQGGMTPEDIRQWILERLQRLPYKACSARLRYGDYPGLMAPVDRALKVVFRGNGYQPRPDDSDKIMRQCAAHWARTGFRLADESTWHLAAKAVMPSRFHLRWEAELEGLLPEFENLLKGDHRQATQVVTAVMDHARGYGELAFSWFGMFMELAGVKGRSKEKQEALRDLMVEHGLLVLHHKYYHDPATGRGHGNFYVPGMRFKFDEDVVDGQEEVGGATHTHTHPTGSTYLPFPGQEPFDQAYEDELMRRIEACDRWYAFRRRKVRAVDPTQTHLLTADQEDEALAMIGQAA